MSTMPQKYIDDFVSFASGETHWRQWPRWFAMHAAGLSRVMEREQFRLIRNDPQHEVPRFLQASGIAVTPVVPDVFFDELHVDTAPVGEISDLEYELYTLLFQTELFVFTRGNTSIGRLTGIPRIHARYFTDATIGDAFAGAEADRGGLFASFCARNAHRYLLAPKFEVPNGYILVSDCERPDFVISRAGLNASQSEAVVYIACVGCIGYLIGFLRRDNFWYRAGHVGLWVT